MLTFPTRPGPIDWGTQVGTPLEAQPCRCDHAFGADGSCVLCGRWELVTIRQTWSDRAAQLA